MIVLLYKDGNYQTFQEFEDTRIRQLISEFDANDYAQTKIAICQESGRFSGNPVKANLFLFTDGSYYLSDAGTRMPDKKVCKVVWSNNLVLMSCWQYDIPIGSFVEADHGVIGRVERRFTTNGVYAISYVLKKATDLGYEGVLSERGKDLQPSNQNLRLTHLELSEESLNYLIRTALSIWLA